MNNNELMLINEESIKDKIYVIRGIPVMLDRDLALIYGYKTEVLNQQVKRNINKFPTEMMFQLTNNEFRILISQNVISRWGGTRKLPYVFTEKGVYMLATVLKSERAVKQAIELIDLFTAMKYHILNENNEANKLLLRHDNEINDIKTNMATKEEIKDLSGKVDLIRHNFLIDNITIPFIISNGHKYEMNKYFKVFIV